MRGEHRARIGRRRRDGSGCGRSAGRRCPAARRRSSARDANPARRASALVIRAGSTTSTASTTIRPAAVRYVLPGDDLGPLPAPEREGDLTALDRRAGSGSGSALTQSFTDLGLRLALKARDADDGGMHPRNPSHRTAAGATATPACAGSAAHPLVARRRARRHRPVRRTRRPGRRRHRERREDRGHARPRDHRDHRSTASSSTSSDDDDRALADERDTRARSTVDHGHVGDDHADDGHHDHARRRPCRRRTPSRRSSRERRDGRASSPTRRSGTSPAAPASSR